MRGTSHKNCPLAPSLTYWWRIPYSKQDLELCVDRGVEDQIRYPRGGLAPCVALFEMREQKSRLYSPAQNELQGAFVAASFFVSHYMTEEIIWDFSQHPAGAACGHDAVDTVFPQVSVPDLQHMSA